MRKYLMFGIEVREDVDDDTVVDQAAEALKACDIGRYKPDDDQRGVALVVNVPENRQLEFNGLLRKIDMAELMR